MPWQSQPISVMCRRHTSLGTAELHAKLITLRGKNFTATDSSVAYMGM